MGYEPENTLQSFEKAIEQQVDMIELDVYTLKSGETVVIHDDRVDRTTDGEGYVWDFTYEDLRKLDAGGGQQIPTLLEVLGKVNRKSAVNIELKGTATARPVSDIIRKCTSEGWDSEDFLVSSFNHHELLDFQQQIPEVKIGALILAIPLNYAQFAEELGASSVNPGIEFVNKEFVEDAHRRGLEVNVWTVNHPDDMERIAALGVDGIFTNFPDVAKRVFTDDF